MNTNVDMPARGAPWPGPLSVHLTQQFYEWERWGRGWQIWDGPVEIEPPFRPFLPTLPDAGPSLDDGRRDTWLSRWLDRLFGVERAQTNGGPFAPVVPMPPRFLEKSEPVVEFQITLPPAEAVPKQMAEHFLLNMVSRHPVSFEVVATHDAIVVQFACKELDAAQLEGQIRAHFPDAEVDTGDEFLLGVWLNNRHAEPAIVDFGLSQEFMRPVRTFRQFDSDPLVGIVGALDDLEAGDVGILQVLFQPVRHPWAESLIHAVTDRRGRSFFMDAPEMPGLAREKIAHPLYAAVVRAAASSSQPGRAWQLARALGCGLAQFSNPSSNELMPLDDRGYSVQSHEADLLFRENHRSGMLLNANELVGLVHPPGPSVRAERLSRIVERSKAAPAFATGGEILLGHNSHRGVSQPVTLDADQRSRHVYTVGASGTGKSTFLLNLLSQDIEEGRGVALLDPHGDLVDDILARIPEHRFQDVIVLDPADGDFPIGFNILSAHSELEKTLIASDMVAVFRRLATSWGDQMTTVFANAILAFLESPRGGTLSDLRRFLVEKDYRRDYLESVQDRDVVYYWQKEFPLLSGRPQAPILTRLDAFLRPKSIRYMVAQPENKLDFADLMSSGKILLARLSQGAIGEENAHLLGAMIVSKLHQMTLGRQEIAEARRRPFYLYMDEFQHFVTPSMASILTGARKYRLGLVMAHQELRQLEKRDAEVASAVLANPCTRVCFRVGEADAKKLAEGLGYFEPRDLLGLGTGEAVCRIDRADCDFNLRVPAPQRISASAGADVRDQVKSLSRKRYGTPRHEVESLLEKRWAEQADPREESAPDAPRAKPRPDPAPETTEPAKKRSVAASGAAKTKSSDTPVAAPALMGKGGPEHRYLQQFIKRWGEGMGYRATIEKPLDGGASIDVVLEKGDVSIACEIAVTTAPEHEVANVRKCLEAGYTTVVTISRDPGKRAAIEQRLERDLSTGESQHVRCLSPEALFDLIEGMEADSASRTRNVRGYEVKVKYGTVSAQEKKVRKRAVSQVILGALSRKK